jgi:hypothetical protein
MPISNDPNAWQQQMAPTPGSALGTSGSGMQLRSRVSDAPQRSSSAFLQHTDTLGVL